LAFKLAVSCFSSPRICSAISLPLISVAVIVSFPPSG
jgi:hypothetical protein